MFDSSSTAGCSSTPPLDTAGKLRFKGTASLTGDLLTKHQRKHKPYTGADGRLEYLEYDIFSKHFGGKSDTSTVTTVHLCGLEVVLGTTDDQRKFLELATVVLWWPGLLLF